MDKIERMLKLLKPFPFLFLVFFSRIRNVSNNEICGVFVTSIIFSVDVFTPRSKKFLDKNDNADFSIHFKARVILKLDFYLPRAFEFVCFLNCSPKYV